MKLLSSLFTIAPQADEFLAPWRNLPSRFVFFGTWGLVGGLILLVLHSFFLVE